MSEVSKEPGSEKKKTGAHQEDKEKLTELVFLGVERDSAGHYSRVAHYQNKEGQTFVVQLKGTNKELVQRRTHGLKAKIILLPATKTAVLLKESGLDKKFKSTTTKEEVAQGLTSVLDEVPFPDKGTVMEVGVVDSKGLEKYSVQFTLDPHLNYEDEPWYQRIGRAQWAAVDVLVNQGSINATLYRAGNTVAGPTTFGGQAIRSGSVSYGDDGYAAYSVEFEPVNNANDFTYTINYG